MKKCPSCSKTYEDSMRFCQVDGTPLIDDVPAFDPYATIVAQPLPKQPAPAAEPPKTAEPASEPKAQPKFPQAEKTTSEPVNPTVSSVPIHEPEDVLDLPSQDPLKTMYVSEAEMRAAFSQEEKPSVVEIPPIEETPEPDFAKKSLSDIEPPPSPFSTPSNAEDRPVSFPSFDDPKKDDGDFDEAATVIQPAFIPPVSTSNPEPDTPPAWAPPPSPHAEWTPTPAAEPVAEWNPPPAPAPQWQNQEIGSNTPLQPPPSGTGATTNTLGLVSLILGIVSFVCLYGIGGLAAVILGLIQRSKIKKDPSQYGGGGLAMAGIILGILNIIAFIGILIVYAGIIFASLR